MEVNPVVLRMNYFLRHLRLNRNEIAVCEWSDVVNLVNRPHVHLLNYVVVIGRHCTPSHDKSISRCTVTTRHSLA